jgi:hypothetical protein
VNVMEGTGKYSAQISGRQQESPMYLVEKRCQVDTTDTGTRACATVVLYNSACS